MKYNDPERLGQTIRALNAALKGGTIRFGRDGDGGATWSHR
ncbi:MAG TPA: hypothetical protein VKD72_36385 [Gemmataceae bacterium]|nr:hypothetical protein [Gemmataceae bacterium]